MSAASLIEAIRDRIPFRDLKAVFAARESATTAGGWAALTAEIEGSTDKGATLLRLIQELHAEITLAGSKEVYVFDLDDAAVAEISAALAAATPQGEYANGYPMPLPESRLANMNSEHQLAAKFVRDNGDVSLVFCAKRLIQDRTEYSLDQVTSAVREAFSGYNRFIAISTREFQVYDVISIRPQLKRLEILIDQPDKTLEKEEIENRVLAVLGLLAPSCPSLMAIYEGNSPINLFNCISGIYNTKTEGRINKLAFRAPSKSMKKESVTSSEDLRKEEYHEAGVGKVGHITPYDITVSWENLNGSGPVSLRVFAPISALSGVGAFVRSARLVAAQNERAVVSAVNKLVSYST